LIMLEEKKSMVTSIDRNLSLNEHLSPDLLPSWEQTFHVEKIERKCMSSLHTVNCDISLHEVTQRPLPKKRIIEKKSLVDVVEQQGKIHVYLCTLK